MREEEFKRWMRLGLGEKKYSSITIKKSITYLHFLERKLSIDMDKITLEDLADILADMEDEGIPVKTLNSWIKYLNRYLLFRGMNKLKYRPQWENPDVYFYVPTDEDKDKILAVRWTRPEVHWRNHTMLLILFDTGIRINELVHLNWQDIDSSPDGMPIIHIRHGKGAKQRVVPIHPKVIDKLYTYKKYYRIDSDPNAIFTTIKRRITYDYARTLMKEAGRKAGVPQFHAHAARHWRAITWLKEGINLETIRRFLGHANIKSTAIYVRWLEMRDSFSEIRNKDKTFGGWAPLGPEYLKKKGGV